jgi:hypothetical protein
VTNDGARIHYPETAYIAIDTEDRSVADYRTVGDPRAFGTNRVRGNEGDRRKALSSDPLNDLGPTSEAFSVYSAE